MKKLTFLLTLVLFTFGNSNYNTTCAATSAPTLTADPTALDFGSIAKNTTATAKTFTISGYNLGQGNLTITAPAGYTVSPSIVAVDGTLANTTITVTPDISTAGTFNGNVTISGGGLASDVELALTMKVLEVYTIKWKKAVGWASSTVTEGESLGELPPAADCSSGKKFMGWTEATFVNSDGSDIVYAKETDIPTCDTEYNAVYAIVEANTTGTASVAAKSYDYSLDCDKYVYYVRQINLTSNGDYGTICLPYGSSQFAGAEFYEVSYLVAGQGLWLDQLSEGASLEAGKPYIFKATGNKLVVYYEGEAADAPVAGENGLTGTFTNISANTDLMGHYIIAQNQIWVANANNTLPANRAYINSSLVPSTAQAPIPGRCRVCMGANGENAATGVEDVITANAPQKVIENGQLIIIRNGEKYNIQGQKL